MILLAFPGANHGDIAYEKVTISLDDIFTYRLRDESETLEMFGEAYLDEMGIEVPAELLSEYRSVMVKYAALQVNLKKHQEEKEKELYDW